MSSICGHSGVNEQNSAVVLVLFLSIYSVVIADPKLGKELDNELLDLNISPMLNEKDGWRNDNVEQQDWRKSDNAEESNVSWGAISIYKDTKQLPPGLTPIENEIEQSVDSRKPATQFRLKF